MSYTHESTYRSLHIDAPDYIRHIGVPSHITGLSAVRVTSTLSPS